ncbi:hypothetical protein [Youngiibacter fragilis]|uniref:Uncharacterized protein n=1 Tax=Youngiibacter fragilis 232.1 TaxID=994573 RepID=V7I5Q2_9CLOT|nr:hypothetical protein [Youngiibacter fragilis]ETA80524.1 hypothetical protein T472_0211505 [Youngiibacter fragilis 232.1]
MTIYETLHGVTSYITDEDANVKSCLLCEVNILETAFGRLVPKWKEDIRKKGIPSLSFYPGGVLKSVALEEQTLVSTPLGKLPAEFLTFYPGGELRRIFPCNGKITAYWSEEEEAALCPTLSFALHCGAFRAKVTAIHFYPSGALRSMSLWPDETVVLRAFQGFMPTRIGFSLYEGGALESVEPPYPMSIDTPIGAISAFDPHALGVHGDSNSLAYNQDGSLRSITTADSKIEVITPDRQSIFFAPSKRQDSLLDDRTVVVPVRISFTSDSITFDNGVDIKTFSLIECCFRIFSADSLIAMGSGNTDCSDCSTCNRCG